jgi:hypothetical protein
VSRTRKDSHQNRVLEVVKRDDGTFDLFLNRNVYQSGVSEDTRHASFAGASDTVVRNMKRFCVN